MSKFTPKEWQKLRNGDWWESVDFESTRPIYTKTISDCKKAIAEYNQTDRPLRILIVHGSPRATAKTAADELSNSKILLETGLKNLEKKLGDIEIDRIDLVDHLIEPCQGCLSTCSALCAFPCNCHPLDDMSTEFYAKILRADILFCSTPVNQSTMSTRLKAFVDRMISLDGGIYITAEQYHPKNQEWRSRMMELSASGKVAYDQRLYGRVAAYFISSKDDSNPLPINNKIKTSIDKFSYIEKTANILKDGMEDYGYFHNPDGWYAGFAAKPDEDYMWDKQKLNSDHKAIKESERIIMNSVKLAKKLKKELPPFKTDRINRT